jgi:hypothetical protein
MTLAQWQSWPLTPIGTVTRGIERRLAAGENQVLDVAAAWATYNARTFGPGSVDDALRRRAGSTHNRRRAAATGRQEEESFG